MRTIKLFLALAVTVGYFSTAHAVSVQFKPGSSAVATGITGLDVAGTIYDVDFTGKFTHIDWASMLDVTTPAEATDVVLAIGNALDSAGVTHIEHDLSSGGTFDHTVATLHYGTTSTDLLGVAISAGNTGGWGGFAGGSTAPLNDSKPLAIDLTVSAVPVPAAVWLFGSGVLGLVGIARHKKA